MKAEGWGVQAFGETPSVSPSRRQRAQGTSLNFTCRFSTNNLLPSLLVSVPPFGGEALLNY